MRVSRAQMEENHCAILDAASRLFRDRGFEAVSVSEVMKAAGFTHGGFYGHFRSKDDLVAQALSHALEVHPLAPQSPDSSSLDLDAIIDRYLSPRHRDNAAGGCPTACLAAETRHQPLAAKRALTEGLRHQLESLGQASPEAEAEDKRRAAMGRWSAMVGAVILARAVDDPALSDDILEQTREWLHQDLHQSLPQSLFQVLPSETDT
ncbi:TetR/AcrR family transcriptional regulator [Salinicola halimionae]|uniref:TetR/AcrR family transcriptional regulator n=1 Tax=Salinicola halimionae TaxID=1949081 RepID=UPI000DA11F23|nr:TetR/AcrR family transcriptional regulator [Salinicola halimionae]